MTKMQTKEKIEPMLQGVLYISEADSPVSIIQTQALTTEELRKEISEKHGATMEQISAVDAASFFDGIVKNASPSDPLMMQHAQQLNTIYQTLLENTSTITVYRIEGNVEIPIYIACKTTDGLFCLYTEAVES